MQTLKTIIKTAASYIWKAFLFVTHIIAQFFTNETKWAKVVWLCIDAFFIYGILYRIYNFNPSNPSDVDNLFTNALGGLFWAFHFGFIATWLIVTMVDESADKRWRNVMKHMVATDTDDQKKILDKAVNDKNLRRIHLHADRLLDNYVQYKRSWSSFPRRAAEGQLARQVYPRSLEQVYRAY